MVDFVNFCVTHRFCEGKMPSNNPFAKLLEEGSNDNNNGTPNFLTFTFCLQHNVAYSIPSLDDETSPPSEQMSDVIFLSIANDNSSPVQIGLISGLLCLF